MSACDFGDWGFYRALAAFKLTVVEGIRHRAEAGAGDTTAAPAAVPELIAEGLSLLTEPSSGIARSEETA